MNPTTLIVICLIVAIFLFLAGVKIGATLKEMSYQGTHSSKVFEIKLKQQETKKIEVIVFCCQKDLKAAREMLGDICNANKGLSFGSLCQFRKNVIDSFGFMRTEAITFTEVTEVT